jgi:hypothetical protein
MLVLVLVLVPVLVLVLVPVLVLVLVPVLVLAPVPCMSASASGGAAVSTDAGGTGVASVAGGLQQSLSTTSRTTQLLTCKLSWTAAAAAGRKP